MWSALVIKQILHPSNPMGTLAQVFGSVQYHNIYCFTQNCQNVLSYLTDWLCAWIAGLLIVLLTTQRTLDTFLFLQRLTPFAKETARKQWPHSHLPPVKTGSISQHFRYNHNIYMNNFIKPLDEYITVDRERIFSNKNCFYGLTGQINLGTEYIITLFLVSALCFPH